MTKITPETKQHLTTQPNFTIMHNHLLASLIDHTALKPNTVQANIEQLCREAILYHFAAVCVPPTYAKQAIRLLDDTPIKVATVLGFPLGYQPLSIKIAEAKWQCSVGVDEVDMVINIGWVKDGRWQKTAGEITAITHCVQARQKIIKVIFETALLTNNEIIQLCEICDAAGVDFVKTSTGFSGGGATPEVVSLMRNNLSDDVQIKASGGIRTAEQANAMVAAGATRLGCSNSIDIVTATP